MCTLIKLKGPLHVDKLKFNPGLKLHEHFTTRVENKNISTRAEIKNTIYSMFMRHENDCYKKL